MHRHHIVFRSQGGLDFEMNYKYYRGYLEHEGPEGPHKNREVDLMLKLDLQCKLERLFEDELYSLKEISCILGRTERYFEAPFRKVSKTADGRYKREDIIRRLMGGKIYAPRRESISHITDLLNPITGEGAAVRAPQKKDEGNNEIPGKQVELSQMDNQLLPGAPQLS